MGRCDLPGADFEKWVHGQAIVTYGMQDRGQRGYWVSGQHLEVSGSGIAFGKDVWVGKGKYELVNHKEIKTMPHKLRNEIWGSFRA